ncbi:IS630 family transposase [Azospirillum doebereinerae]|uniref:IS630 family transposase n=1 Tax=Azospirillum doebereinerae TaxID=92933 RepID=UPI001EE5BE5A|nr:IS630 family transposase [Azospirillum doebereinerae]MCG5239929.1 IS630 family transposase [Azospirillum doebereinerae]
MAATAARLEVGRVFAMDEARFGLKVSHRRLWCPFGHRPPWTHEHEYRWLWLYAAVEPTSGACFVLFLPHVDGRCFQRFLEELRRDLGPDRLGLVLDNSGSHTSGKVIWPEGVTKIPLPPYSPELNPAERWFEALRRVFANRIFESLDQLQEALAAALEPYWTVPATLQRLVGYPWWCQAIATLPPVPPHPERKT